MKIWLRILGGAYIVVGSLNSFVFLFILVVYGGKGGIGAIRAEEYVPVIGHLGGWILYVLLGFSVAGILAGIGLLSCGLGPGGSHCFYLWAISLFSRLGRSSDWRRFSPCFRSKAERSWFLQP